jgi:hypothetical protein
LIIAGNDSVSLLNITGTFAKTILQIYN